MLRSANITVPDGFTGDKKSFTVEGKNQSSIGVL